MVLVADGQNEKWDEGAPSIWEGWLSCHHADTIQELGFPSMIVVYWSFD